jgi:hypothetical protein
MINWPKISLKDLAGFISEELRKKGIEAVLVGGACVTIYTENRYQSYDLDYVTYEDMKKVRKALSELGFTQRNKYFQRKDCPWMIEFVTPPVAIGKDPIWKFANVSTPLGTITCLAPTDSVKDRLASFYFWNDKQGLQQALSICQEREIDLEEIKNWSTREGYEEKFKVFLKSLKKK